MSTQINNFPKNTSTQKRVRRTKSELAKERQHVLGYYRQGLPPYEIAHKIGISPSRVIEILKTAIYLKEIQPITLTYEVVPATQVFLELVLRLLQCRPNDMLKIEKVDNALLIEVFQPQNPLNTSEVKHEFD